MSTNDFQLNTTNPYIRVYGLTKKEIIQKTILTLSIWMIIWHAICYFVYTAEPNTNLTNTEALVCYFIFTILILFAYYITTFVRYFACIEVDAEKISLIVLGQRGKSYPLKYFQRMKKTHITNSNIYIGVWYELLFDIPAKGIESMVVPPLKKDSLYSMLNDINSMKSFGTFSPERNSFLDEFSIIPDSNDENSNKYVPLKINKNRLIQSRKSLISFYMKLLLIFYLVFFILGFFLIWLMSFDNTSIHSMLLLVCVLFFGPLLIFLNSKRIILASIKTIPTIITLSITGIKIDDKLFPLNKIEKIQLTSPIDLRNQFHYTRMLTIYSMGKKYSYLIGDTMDRHNISLNNQYLFYCEAIYQYCQEYNIFFEEDMECDATFH